MSLAEQVKRLREQELAFTQEELAAELGVRAVQISRWERGKAEPSLIHLRRLALLAGRPVSSFFTDDDKAAA